MLERIHTDFIRQSLKQNSYANFASCFPTPAAYCPSALEGVWKQLNGRLEEECIKDFHKLCVERDVEAGLAGWEELVEDAKRRRKEWEERGGDEKSGQGGGEKAMHEMSAEELYDAHAVAGLVRAEQELTGKLEVVQNGNREMMDKIHAQREEMRRLVNVLEGLVEDIERAAGVVQNDEMRDKIKQGLMADTEDVRMGG